MGEGGKNGIPKVAPGGYILLLLPPYACATTVAATIIAAATQVRRNRAGNAPLPHPLLSRVQHKFTHFPTTSALGAERAHYGCAVSIPVPGYLLSP